MVGECGGGGSGGKAECIETTESDGSPATPRPRRLLPSPPPPRTHHEGRVQHRLHHPLQAVGVDLAGGSARHQQQQRHPLQARQVAAQRQAQQQAGAHDLQVAQDLVGRGVDMLQEGELQAAATYGRGAAERWS